MNYSTCTQVCLSALTALWLTLSPLAHAQDAAVANRATELKAAESADSVTLAPVAAKTPMTIVERRGKWAKVKVAGREGFIPMFHYQSVAVRSAGESEGNMLTAAVGALSSGGPRTKKTDKATVGVQGLNNAPTAAGSNEAVEYKPPPEPQLIRGLPADDLSKVQPNPGRLAQFKAQQLSKPAAQAFAQNSRLVSNAGILYLDGNGKWLPAGATQ